MYVGWRSPSSVPFAGIRSWICALNAKRIRDLRRSMSAPWHGVPVTYVRMHLRSARFPLSLYIAMAQNTSRLPVGQPRMGTAKVGTAR